MRTWRSGLPRLRRRRSSADASQRSRSRSMRAGITWQSAGRSQTCARSDGSRPMTALPRASVVRWMRSQLPGIDVTLRADSLLAMRQAALAGLGLAALPCYLGDTSPGSRLRASAGPGDGDALWVLTHADLRHTARIRAFTEFAAGAFGRRRPLLEGAQARPRGRKGWLRARAVDAEAVHSCSFRAQKRRSQCGRTRPISVARARGRRLADRRGRVTDKSTIRMTEMVSWKLCSCRCPCSPADCSPCRRGRTPSSRRRPVARSPPRRFKSSSPEHSCSS